MASREKLEKQMRRFRRAPDTVGVVYCSFYKISDDGRQTIPKRNHGLLEGDIQNALQTANFITTQAAVVRSECFEDVGLFDEQLPRLIDWQLWLRIAIRYAFAYVNQPLVGVYQRPDGISQDNSAGVIARKRILRKHGDCFSRETRAAQQFWVGHGSLKIGITGQGRRYLAKAVMTHPRPTYIAALLISLFGATVYQEMYSTITKLGERFQYR